MLTAGQIKRAKRCNHCVHMGVGKCRLKKNEKCITNEHAKKTAWRWNGVYEVLCAGVISCGK